MHLQSCHLCGEAGLYRLPRRKPCDCGCSRSGLRNAARQHSYDGYQNSAQSRAQIGAIKIRNTMSQATRPSSFHIMEAQRHHQQRAMRSCRKRIQLHALADLVLQVQLRPRAKMVGPRAGSPPARRMESAHERLVAEEAEGTGRDMQAITVSQQVWASLGIQPLAGRPCDFASGGASSFSKSSSPSPGFPE